MGLESIAEVESVSTTSKLDTAADAGTNKIRLRTIPHASFVLSRPFILIDAYSSYCEVMQVTSQHNRELTLSSNLVYNHAAGVRVTWLNGRDIYPEMFGPCGPGDDASVAINAALATATLINSGSHSFGRTRKGSVCIRLQPGKWYKILSPINLCNMQGVTLDGGAPGTGGAIIWGCTSGAAMIEIIGSQDVTLQNLQLWGDQTLSPSVGTWTGRSSATHGTNSSTIVFRNINYAGYFNNAAHYCLTSESNQFYECWSYLYGNTGFSGIIYVSSANDLGLTPTHTTLLGTVYGNWDMGIHHCGLSSQPGYTCVVVRDYCRVSMYDSYLYSATDPSVLVYGATLKLVNCGFEGTPDSTIYIAEGTFKNFQLLLQDVGLGTPNNYTIYAADNTVMVKSHFVSGVFPGLTGGVFKPMRFYKAEGCDLSGMYSNDTRAFEINFDKGYSYQCKFFLSDSDTLTYTNGAYSNSDIVEDCSVALTGVLQVPALRINTGTSLKAIVSATKTWDVGNLADGASATNFVSGAALTDVRADGTWIAFASLTSLDELGWVISAVPASDPAIYVTVTNHSGGAIDPPSGTLLVVAIKVG